MKLPLSWLKDYMDIDGLSVEDIARTLTFGGLEVEEIRYVGWEMPASGAKDMHSSQRHEFKTEGIAWDREKIVVAEIREVMPHPNADPYHVVEAAVRRAHERDLALGITNGEHVRPWLQAFTLGQPRYDAHALEEQKRAVYDAGYDGWTLWNPGSLYGPYLAALEKTTVSRRKPFTPRVASRDSASRGR